MNNQKGIALPVALIMFLVMLIGGLYLARSATSASIVVSNLAYQQRLTRASDQGLMQAYDWLGGMQAASKDQLSSDITGSGYIARYDQGIGPTDSDFWANGKTVTIDGNEIEYVIHRMCQSSGIPSTDTCITSRAGVAASGSLDLSDVPPEAPPLIHYVITARVVNAPKGATAVNQLVVMMGA